MQLVNGIEIFEPGEAMVFSPHVPSIPSGDKDALFGFKLVESNGINEWVHGTEEDYTAVHKRMGTTAEQFGSNVAKRKLGKQLCDFTNSNTCGGDCGSLMRCYGHRSPTNPNNYVFCECR